MFSSTYDPKKPLTMTTGVLMVPEETMKAMHAEIERLREALIRARSDLLELADSEQHLAPAIERIDAALAAANGQDGGDVKAIVREGEESDDDELDPTMTDFSPYGY
jgi:hypothetical protein